MTLMEKSPTPTTLLRSILEALVKHPEEIQISQVESPDRITLHVTVHPKDRGRVLGLSGVTAEQIRTVLSAAGGKVGKSIHMSIADRKKAD